MSRYFKKQTLSFDGYIWQVQHELYVTRSTKIHFTSKYENLKYSIQFIRIVEKTYSYILVCLISVLGGMSVLGGKYMKNID